MEKSYVKKKKISSRHNQIGRKTAQSSLKQAISGAGKKIKVLLFPKKLVCVCVCGGGDGRMFIDCWNNFYFSCCLNFRVILQHTEWPRHQQLQQPQQQQHTVMGMQRLGLTESGVFCLFVCFKSIAGERILKGYRNYQHCPFRSQRRKIAKLLIDE